MRTIYFDICNHNKGVMKCTDPDIIGLIRDKLSVKNKNARYIRRYSNRIYDRIYCISRSGKFDIGLFKTIKDLIDKNDIPIRLQYSSEFIQRCVPKFEYCSDDLSELELTPYDYQEFSVHRMLKFGRGVILIGTGGGKCLAENTLVLMYSGQIKKVQNIKIGDILMGDDNTPREVISTCTGIEQMYTISMMDGTSFSCNESHIISLIWNGKDTKKYKKNNIYDYSILEYLDLTKTEKHCLKTIKTGVEFPEKNTNIDPYLMGLWLAEGAKTKYIENTLYICSSDQEIIQYLNNNYNISINNNNDRKTCKCIKLLDGKKYNNHNKFREEFKSCILNKNIIINDNYKINSKKNRLELLAGLIDGDGHLHNNCYEIVTKWKTLSDDICYLVRSLGLRAHISEKTIKGKLYFRIGISGNTDIIPCKVKRKCASKRTQSKDVLRCGFEVIKNNIEPYYGFELKGNNKRFLLGDFTITHNTFIMSLLSKTIKDYNPSTKFLIIVPTIQLVEQTYSDFIDYGINPDLISKWSGENEFQNTDIIIASSSILQSKLSDLSFLNTIDVLIVDEVHMLKKDNLINKIIDKIPTANKFGFTGTMPEEIYDQWNVLGKIGPILYKKDSDSLRNDNFISQVKINIIKIEYNTQTIYELHKKLEKELKKYDVELEFMVKNQFRNDMIAKTAMVSRGNSLIMVDRIEHGNILEKILKKRSKKKIYFIKGDVNVDKREEVRNIMEKNNNIICIAISKIFSTGINVKNMHNILFATPGKAKVKLIQSIGRGLRLHLNKEILNVYDFADDLHYSNKHLAKRILLYTTEKLNYETRIIREQKKRSKEEILC